MIRKKRNNKQIIKKMAILYFTIKIQRFFKKYLERIKLSDELVTKKEGNFINNSTFIGTDFNNLDEIYFFTHNKFFFDIRELRKHIINSNKNPYDNKTFTNFTIRQIKRVYNKVILNVNYQSLEEDYNDDLSYDNILTSMKASIFSKIDENIGTSHFQQFNNFSNLDLISFMEILFNYDLISERFYVERELDILANLYHNYRLEKRRNRRHNRSSYLIHNFNFNHKILNLLNEILNVNNDLDTICHIINESILIC